MDIHEPLSVFSLRTIDRSVFRPIIEIAVIENSESIDCQLLAVTHAGKTQYHLFIVIVHRIKKKYLEHIYLGS